MKLAKYIAAVTLLLFTLRPEGAESSPWHLPILLNDSNTKISFEVDSTWHLVKGTTRNAGGRVWLENPSNPRSVRAVVTLPVGDFDTDSGRRDSRMREVMRAEAHPEVKFSLNSAAHLCNPASVDSATPCPVELVGILEINGQQKSITAPATVTVKEGDFVVAGDVPLRWEEFGVEDPSILIAKLDPVVIVHFRIELKPQAGEA